MLAAGSSARLTRNSPADTDFAKVRVGVDDQVLGLLLLCSGLGSIAAMRLTSLMAARFGSRPIILVSSVALAVFLASRRPLMSGRGGGRTRFDYAARHLPRGW
jgi:hypothetical protein